MSEFIPLRIDRKTSILLFAEPQVVFPLFSPVGELNWVGGWDPILIYPPSGEVQVDSIFLTQHPKGQVVWVTAEYEPENYRVRFIRALAGDHTADIRIQCKPVEHGKTLAEIAYTFTGLK